jgi:undecaprenyl-diphosphatase
MRTLTRMGDASTWVAVGLGLLLSDAVGVLAAGRLAWAAGLATVVVQVLKRSCRRRRPDVAIDGFRALAANPDQFSFPSGHTATAVAVAVAWLGVGIGLGPAAAVLAAGIALSRVGLGAHFPLDVLAGGIIGAGCGGVARLVVVS